MKKRTIKDLEQMKKEPASKEWFEKWGGARKKLAKKMEYTGKKGEYSKTGKQGNWMKVHPLDR